MGPAKVEILVDSHKLMDTDHNMVVAHVMFRARSGNPARRVDTRARVVTSVIPPQPYVDQEILKQLAVEYTKPQVGQGYQDPEYVKVYYRVGKQGGNKEDWKRAHRERHRAREEWRSERLKKALEGNWRKCGRAKRTRMPDGRWDSQTIRCKKGGSPTRPLTTTLKQSSTIG